MRLYMDKYEEALSDLSGMFAIAAGVVVAAALVIMPLRAAMDVKASSIERKEWTISVEQQTPRPL